MNVLTFLTNTATAPFTGAIFVVVCLAMMELASMVFGFALSQILDDVFDSVFDFDTDADIDADADLSGIGFMSWLGVGKVPLLVILVSFIASFGISGWIIQWIYFGSFSTFASVGLVSCVSIILALAPTRVITGLLSKIIPKEETSAVELSTFIGKTATLTQNASQGLSAEAKITDNYGQTHYIRVVPENPDVMLKSGSCVCLTRIVNTSCFEAREI